MKTELLIAFLAGIGIGILLTQIPRLLRKVKKPKASGIITMHNDERGIERFNIYRRADYEPRFWRKFTQSLKNLRVAKKEKGTGGSDNQGDKHG
jgi:hypothetical protein